MADDVVVVVPAHDEAATIGRTLTDVVRALAHAERHGAVRRAAVQVVAHRCRDRTAAVARRALGHAGHVLVDDASPSVGRVRDLGVRLALARGEATDGAWVLSTDADTRVPRSWVVDTLEAARRHRADAVVGLAPLAGLPADRRAVAAYAEILARGLRDATGLRQHDHVYGANLAVRAAAYLAVGGYPDIPVGEDTALVQTLVTTGHRVLRTKDVRVATSARTHGRAAGGLADLLAGLAARPVSVERSR